MKKPLSLIWEIVKIAVIALVIVVPIRYFLFQPFFVKGESMEPNFENGDYLIIDELSYRMREPQRGEVIVFKYPNDPSQRYIKRIIALPEERIEIREGEVAIYNLEGKKVLGETSYLPSVFTPGTVNLTLAEDEYYVMGDNRTASADSRTWGPLPEEFIIGRAIFRAWPFASLSKIGAPDYLTY